MRLNPGLDAAIEVYRALGWDRAEPHEAPSLPIGTPDQQRIAKAGLRSGDWGEFGQIGERTYGWISAVPVQEASLASSRSASESTRRGPPQSCASPTRFRRASSPRR